MLLKEDLVPLLQVIYLLALSPNSSPFDLIASYAHIDIICGWLMFCPFNELNQLTELTVPSEKHQKRHKAKS